MQRIGGQRAIFARFCVKFCSFCDNGRDRLPTLPGALMHVVARLSEYLLTQLRAALAREHTLLAVPNWSELGGVFRGRVVDVIVLEPAPIGADELAPLLRLLASHPAVPVIVYTSVSPAAMRV